MYYLHRTFHSPECKKIVIIEGFFKENALTFFVFVVYDK
ncbi:hypothetical protein NBRC111894_4447 [Sporolactobacillus inulinus]|uniref:Uncharacterized protein n=1 Tax=Sporolactobacillus inulinus TaxID=2078 RepID=A0A4Y1ZIZ0_9BACL|nr:hypothetical protein NBRC111894_4447 [Sporolactobacillus inulinus]